MERTKFTSQGSSVLYPVHDEPIVVSKSLMELFLKDEQDSDLLSLYLFYYYTAKWQHTNQPKATTSYVGQGLNWSTRRVEKAKRRLIELGIIKNVVGTAENGRIVGHYIEIQFLWKSDTSDSPTPAIPHPVGISGTNTLKHNNKNTLEKFLNLFPKEWCDNTAFVEAIKDFITHRTQKHQTPTDIAIKKLANKFIKFDIDTVILAVERSTENGWTGVFPESEGVSPSEKNKPKFITVEGLRYDLKTSGVMSGMYVSKGGTPYIP